MSLKKRIMPKDPRLSIISSEVIRNIPCIESVILCGSRAIIQGVKPLSMPSDYDVAVVMKTPLVPFYLRRIKMVENRLSKKFGVKVNLNPLPTFRIRNAKGNLFLFKVKKEGITIWGKDYISMLNPGCIKDIGTDWYFSYLSSLMKEFVQNFDSSLIHEFSAEHRNLMNCTAKALLGCGELLLLLRGIYEAEARVIVDKLSEYERVKVVGNSFSVDAHFLDSLRVALNIKGGLFTKVDDPLEFCLSTKNYLLEMFRLLMGYFYGSHTLNLDKRVIEYLKAVKGKSFLKNTEYSALVFLIKREAFLKALFSMPIVADRMRAALIWLLAAIKEDKCLCRETLGKAYHALKDYVRIRYSNDDVALWRNIKHTILTYWPYACTVMGV